MKLFQQSCQLNHTVLIQISKRFKKKPPKPPRDPPPTSSFFKQNRDHDFEPFVSRTEFESNPKHTKKWTKIDHAASIRSNTSSSYIDNDMGSTDAIAQSPDILSVHSLPQTLPRTAGIQTIAKYAQQKGFEHRLPPKQKIEIVAEDENYIFVHKPTKIACTNEQHNDQNNDILDVALSNRTKNKNKKKKSESKSFYDLFLEYWWTTYPFFRFVPRLLHKLEDDTSGIMVFGKKWCAEEHFGRLRQGNSDYFDGCGIKQCFIGVCKGTPLKNEGLIEGRIQKSHWNYKRFAIYPHKSNKYVSKEAVIDPFDGSDDHKFVSNQSAAKHGGKHIKTEFKVVDICQHGQFGVCSLIIFTTHTQSDRYHPIRASAASLGCPLVGDTVYGGPKYNMLLLHSLFIGFEGIIDTEIVYGVQCLPKWSHLSHHFWSTKAQFYTQQHLDSLMNVPRPSKKPRVIQYSMRRERAKLKREALYGQSQILLPFASESGSHLIDEKEQKFLEGKEAKNERIKKEDKSRLNAMEDFVANNFIQQTISTHLKQMNKNRRIKVYEKDSFKDDKYDELMQGAVPSHFIDAV